MSSVTALSLQGGSSPSARRARARERVQLTSRCNTATHFDSDHGNGGKGPDADGAKDVRSAICLPFRGGGARGCALTARRARSLCCSCGVTIEPNGMNMCAPCITEQVDITDGIPKQIMVHSCRGCGRSVAVLFPPRRNCNPDPARRFPAATSGHPGRSATGSRPSCWRSACRSCRGCGSG